MSRRFSPLSSGELDAAFGGRRAQGGALRILASNAAISPTLGGPSGVAGLQAQRAAGFIAQPVAPRPRVGGFSYPSDDPAALEFPGIASLAEPERSTLLGMVRGFYNPTTHRMSESNDVMRRDGVSGTINPTLANYAWLWLLYQAAAGLESKGGASRIAAARELDHLAAFGYGFIIPWGTKWRAFPNTSLTAYTGGYVSPVDTNNAGKIVLHDSLGTQKLSCTKAMLSRVSWAGLTGDQSGTLYWSFRNGNTLLNPAVDPAKATYVADNIAHAVWRESDLASGRERYDCVFSSWV